MDRESKRQARVRQQEIGQRERDSRYAHKENQVGEGAIRYSNILDFPYRLPTVI